jgi:hypothetical protein
MSYVSGYAEDPKSLGWSGELAARIAEIVARGARGATERFEALRRAIEEKVRSDGLRQGLLGLVRRFRSQVQASGRTEEDVSDAEWLALVERITAYGRDRSIESYTLYLFSLDGLGGPEDL